MQYRTLGDSDTKVSLICLGTMTWGEQNSCKEAFEQLDYATDQGVNFIDTAEMYAIPPREETQGLTETYLGRWLARRSDRDRLVIATKVAGPGMMSYLRGGPKLTEKHIVQALNDSLKRLQTDYVDLYQVHWPARKTNFFGQLGYIHADEAATPIEETLEVLARLVAAGKIRYLGISNETPWGTMEYLRLSDQRHFPRIVSIQNPYNLLNRTFEVGLAEIAHREKVGLLAYSPLAFGALSGKYLYGNKPPQARLTLFTHFQRYLNPLGVQMTQRYAEIAQTANLSPATLALAYVNQRSFLTANIIGATTLEQLQENIASVDVTLDADTLKAIEATHTAHPNPCP